MVADAEVEELKRRLTQAESALRDRTKVEAALRESEEKYRTLFDSIDEGFCLIEVIFDADGRAFDLLHLEANKSYERYTGLKNIVGKRAREIVPDGGPWLDFYGNVALTGQPARLEAYLPPGVDRWISSYASRVGGDGSRKVAVVFNDITDRKRAEHELLKSNELLRTTLDSSLQIIQLFKAVRNEHDVIVDFEWLLTNKQWNDRWGPRAGRSLLEENPAVVESGIWDKFLEVMQSGAPITHEHYYRHEQFDGWFLQTIAKAEDGILLSTLDITDRKRAETALRDSEERQAFLLALADGLRPMADAVEIMATASEMLGKHLGVGRVGYGELEDRSSRNPGQVAKETYLKVARDWTDGIMSSGAGVHRFADFGEEMNAAFLRGEPFVLEDALATFAGDQEVLRRYEIAGAMRSSLALPLMKQGIVVAGMFVQHSAPRAWSETDMRLISEVADRTWAAVERARAEERLRQSEERFQQFGRASSDGLWIRDAMSLALEYASDAMEVIYGVSRAAMMADPKVWPALLVPEDRDETLGYFELVKAGDSVVHEFRIQRPSDLEFRWIRSVGFPLFDSDNRVRRIAGISSDITEEKQLTEHQGVLLAELQHRVRNIMAIIRSIVARTADGAASTADYVELLSGRLLTLARVQALLTRAANARVGMFAIVHNELAAQATRAGQFDVAGSDVRLSPKAAETMTLAVHELTTNALKYGALSSPSGKVEVRWEMVEKRGTPWLSFDWIESGAPARDSSGPRRTGFGSELIEGRVPYELSGRGMLTIEPGGARCHLEFPLKDGMSVLETDAPKRATVFGGAIDMSGQAELTGQRVLVVEDDYYLATDTARALKGAGAQVIGPCATEADAREELAQTPSTCAVLDINLKGGRSFNLARELKRERVPFVFITGYDQEVIPDDLADVTRLQKPVQFREIVSALAGSLGIDRSLETESGKSRKKSSSDSKKNRTAE